MSHYHVQRLPVFGIGFMTVITALGQYCIVSYLVQLH
jgi:hypothetical protein